MTAKEEISKILLQLSYRLITEREAEKRIFEIFDSGAVV
jgi:hypothetical protein